MPLRLSEHLEHDRPRERFWAVGPGALTGQELLAILLGTGTRGRDALALAGDLLIRGEGSLRRLGPTPSADDRAVTRQLVDAGRVLDVPVYDHVVVGGERYVSFAEAGLL